LELNPDDSDDSDDDQGPKHLVGASFPIHIKGSNKAFTVDMHLSKDTAGITVVGSAFTIVLEAELIEELPDIQQASLLRILEEWKQTQNKSLVEALIVQDDAQNSDAVQYRISATIGDFADFMPE